MFKFIRFVLLLCLPVVAMAQTNDVTDSSVQKRNLQTIYLRDGGVLKGQVIAANETMITIQPSDGEISLLKDYIKEIKVSSENATDIATISLRDKHGSILKGKIIHSDETRVTIQPWVKLNI